MAESQYQVKYYMSKNIKDIKNMKFQKLNKKSRPQESASGEKILRF